jgi:very-short-patch-repair endonuclease
MKFGSKLEVKFSKILTKANIKWIKQYKLKNKYYDFFLPEYNVLVEVDGNYIHTNPNAGFFIDKRFKRRIKRNDSFKNILAEQKGFKLIRIWESELENFNLNDFMLKLK